MTLNWQHLKGIFTADEHRAVGVGRVLQARKSAGNVKLFAFDAAQKLSRRTKLI